MTKGADGSGEAPGSAAGGAIDLSALDGVIGYQLRRAQLAVFDDFIRAFAEHHIRPSHYGALTAIERNPGSSQAAIAQSLGNQAVELRQNGRRVRKARAGRPPRRSPPIAAPTPCI